MRIRSVKPEWLDDELLAAGSDEARVLSIALLLMSDDYGRGRASLATIAAGAWRYQMERDDGAHAPEVLARASRALRELVEMRFVVLYEVDRQRYFAIRNWSRHQKVDKPSAPRIPAPPDTESQDNPATREGSPSVPRDTREDVASPPRDTRARSGSGSGSGPGSGSGIEDREIARASDASRALGVHQPKADRLALMQRLAAEHSARVKVATGKPGMSASACEAIGRGAPAMAHRKTSEHLETLADWLAEQDPNDPAALFRRVLDGAASDSWMVGAGLPLGPIAENPAKYLAPSKPTKRDGWQPPADHTQFTDTEITPDLFALESSK